MCAKHHGEQKRTKGRNSSRMNSQTKDEDRCDTHKGVINIWEGEKEDWGADGAVVIVG